ncbi:MAG: hypothetical protein GY820_12895 [Gammaproteobacteria bacterium]|nr:hypothetical protein [Gammaproteobacteria bacterium]
MNSIKSRLTLVSMIVLVVFMVLTAIALERAVVKRALEAEENRLQLLIYGLLAAVERDISGLAITVANERVFERSLMTQNSGLNILIYNQHRHILWRSPSVTQDFPDIDALALGDWRFRRVEQNGLPYFQMAFALQWPDVLNRLQPYSFVVWKNASLFFKDLERFRQTLWTWLIITTFLLLILMYLVTMWSLRPLKQLGDEVKAIENRKQGGFQNIYPNEIRPLTENLNILLNREQHQRQRYRNAMDDLAHSLKTPLAVLKGLSPRSDIGQEQASTLREQVDRMNQIVSYQLQKATSVSSGEILSRLDLVPLINKLLSALGKVYQGKAVKVEVALDHHLLVRIDEGDCMEVIGNLLDNAFKYGKSNLRVSSRLIYQSKVAIEIEDDGPGLNPDEIEKILNRGTRLDEVSEGQGIGLAVVTDIVKSYNIAMHFDESRFNGLKTVLEFQLA